MKIVQSGIVWRDMGFLQIANQLNDVLRKKKCHSFKRDSLSQKPKIEALFSTYAKAISKSS